MLMHSRDNTDCSNRDLETLAQRMYIIVSYTCIIKGADPQSLSELG